ncbi:hypothetical protein SAMN06295910_0616 [Allosphingosinicella indica]|uniref:Cell wall polymerase n=2 Tax=Allosphingosinicella indica TaxID=941907 RepID=A0A1X7FZT1_9SPHN|nr:hypothetical protein SAMN06295910_0616 [Allosphingosinicella indica]
MLMRRNGNPKAIGVGCAVAAVALGIVYMVAAGAPAQMLILNGASVALGLLLMVAVARIGVHARGDVAAIAIGGALIATALFGVTATGVTRWAALGPILLQPSLLLLPMLVIAFARARAPASTFGITLAALALALQPDRAMAATLAAAMGALFLLERDRWAGIGLAAGLSAFAVTLAIPDFSPAVPFVDGIFYSAFDAGLAAGLAVAGGAALLLVPPLVGLRSPNTRTASAVAGATWLTVILAAALGNYPTPLVGYGGSAIIGYLLALAILPRTVAEGSKVDASASRTPDGNVGASLATALA